MSSTTSKIKLKNAKINGIDQKTYIIKNSIVYKDKNEKYKQLHIDYDNVVNQFQNNEDEFVFKLTSMNHNHTVVLNQKSDINIDDVVRVVNDFLFFNRNGYNLVNYEDNNLFYRYKIPVDTKVLLVTAVKDNDDMYKIEINENNFIFYKIFKLLKKNKFKPLYRNQFCISINKEKKDIKIQLDYSINITNKDCKNFYINDNKNNSISIQWLNRYKTTISTTSDNNYYLRLVDINYTKEKASNIPFLQKAKDFIKLT
jgi:hypothetical protein